MPNPIETMAVIASSNRAIFALLLVIQKPAFDQISS
jgi:hypothetical protein